MPETPRRRWRPSRTGSTPTAGSAAVSWTRSSASTTPRRTRRPPRNSSATRSPRTRRPSRSSSPGSSRPTPARATPRPRPWSSTPPWSRPTTSPTASSRRSSGARSNRNNSELYEKATAFLGADALLGSQAVAVQRGPAGVHVRVATPTGVRSSTPTSWWSPSRRCSARSPGSTWTTGAGAVRAVPGEGVLDRRGPPARSARRRGHRQHRRGHPVPPAGPARHLRRLADRRARPLQRQVRQRPAAHRGPGAGGHHRRAAPGGHRRHLPAGTGAARGAEEPQPVRAERQRRGHRRRLLPTGCTDCRAATAPTTTAAPSSRTTRPRCGSSPSAYSPRSRAEVPGLPGDQEVYRTALGASCGKPLDHAA